MNNLNFLSYKNLFLFLFFLLFISSKELLAFNRIKENDPAPEISLLDINNKTISLSDYKGKKVVALLFWKNPSLRGEKAIRFLQKLNDMYFEKFSFQVLSVYIPQNDDRVTDEEIAEIKQIIENNKITIPVLIDKGMEIFGKYGVITLPSTALIDKDGIVIYELPGLSEFFGEKNIFQNVKKALGIKEEEKIIVQEAYKSKNNASYFLNLSKQVYKKGNLYKAIEHTTTAISRDPEFAEAHSYLGFLYTQQKEYKKAIEAYTKSLQFDSTNNEALLAYGFLCIATDLNEEAFMQFKNIIQYVPEKAAEGYFGIGVINLKNAIYDSAIVNQGKAIELYNTWKKFSEEEHIHFALAYYNLGEIYLKMNQKTKAVQNFKESYKIYEGITTGMLKGKESMFDYGSFLQK